MTIVALLTGLFVGAGGVLLLLRSALVERRERGERALELERELAGTTARLEAAERSFDTSLAEAVRSASMEAFRDSGTRYLDAARGQLESTVAPLKQSLQDVGLRVQELDRAREHAYGALRQQVSVLSERTGSLANALRSPSVRGRWGEAQLRNVVELAGMIEHCDFVAQASTRDAEGDLLRPDLVVRIPGGKQVVVDAKVPLAAYLEAFETSDETNGGSALPPMRGRCASTRRSSRRRRTGGSSRRAPTSSSCSFPTRRCFVSRTSTTAGSPRTACGHGVLLASPSTLMTLLRTVAARLAAGDGRAKRPDRPRARAELHKRLGTLQGISRRSARALDGAVGAYNEAVGSFESRVLVQARRLEEHGVTGEIGAPAQIERQARSIDVHEPTRRPSRASPRRARRLTVARVGTPAAAVSFLHSRGYTRPGEHWKHRERRSQRDRDRRRARRLHGRPLRGPANLEPLVIEGFNWGGQLMITSDVENYPGYADGVMGPAMMQDFRRQAERFGAGFVTDDVTRVDFSQRPFRIWVGDDEYRAESVIVATGASARQLGLPSEQLLQGEASRTARPATRRSSATRSWWSSAAATRRWRRRSSSRASRAR